jgi:uncharacterized protein (TIGR03382 family)
MSQPESARPEPGPDAGIDELRTDIEETRRELGDTVGALSAKLDVKTRTKEKAAETRDLVTDKAHAVQHATLDDGRAKVTVPVAALVVFGAATLLWLLRRRR